jgi:hypothetical protein
MTTPPTREPGPPGPADDPAAPAHFERVKLTGEQARLVRFVLIVVAATLLFSAITILVVVN